MKVLPLCLAAMVAFACAEEPTPPAPPPADSSTHAPEPIPASDIKTIAAKTGSFITIKGEVEQFDRTKAGHFRLFFKDGIQCWISQEVAAKQTDWKLKDFVGKQLIAGGQVRTHFKNYQLVITGPECFAESLDKLDWKLITGAAAAAASPGGGTGAVPSGPPIKLGTTTVRQIVLASDPRGLSLAVSTLSGSWKKKASPKSDGIIYQTQANKIPPAMATGMQFIQGKYPELPGGQSFHVTRVADSSPTMPPPSAIASYVLVDASLSGLIIPETLHFLGDISANQDFGEDAEAILLTASVPPGSILIAPKSTEPLMLDMAREGNMEAICRSQVFGAGNLNDALALIPLLSQPETKALVDKCNLLQAAILSTKGTALRQPAAREFLQSLVAKLPSHLTGKTLLTAASGRLPSRLSEATALFKLEEFCGRLHPALASLPNDKASRKKMFEEFNAEFAKLKPLCPDKMKPAPDTIAELLDATRDWVKYDNSDDSERAKKANTAFKKALDDVRDQFAPQSKAGRKKKIPAQE